MTSIELPTVLKLFAEVLSRKMIQRWLCSEAYESDPSHPRGFYERIFSPIVTLWYLIFQRLNADKTLDAVVKDLHRGGADRFSPSRQQPLSKKIRSYATTSYSDARQEMSLKFVQWALGRTGEHVQKAMFKPGVGPWSFQLIDGSTLPVLATPSLAKAYPPASNQHGSSDWCVMRVVVGFCALTGVALSAVEGSIMLSEQALAWSLIAQGRSGTVWIGDRNFGIWSVAAKAIHHDQHALVRLTKARANRLVKGRRWVSGQDEDIFWLRTKHDKISPDTEKVEVKGRLIYVRVQRGGSFIDLWLFTTLDREEFPVSRVVELYGWRWQAEVNFRYVKTALDMQELRVQSPEMARKEFYAGLIAYNLVRVVMAAAEPPDPNKPASQLSFSQVVRVLMHWLGDLAKDWRSRQGSLEEKIKELIAEVAKQTLPKRKKPRPSEPRRVRRRAAKFPTLKGPREIARSTMTLSK